MISVNPLSLLLPFFNLLFFVGLSLKGSASDQSSFPDIFRQAYLLEQGVNFGNALEAPQEGDWGIRLEERYFDLIKKAGFKTVRLPVRWSAHAQEMPPYTIDPAFFERIDWNSLKKLSELKLPESDRCIIGTFHAYAPFKFTHQGAEWIPGSKAWLRTQWLGTSEEKELIRIELDHAVDWWEKNRRPIWIGEFGSYSKADLPSRCRWTEFIVRECEWRHLPWAYWEFGAGFGLYDRLQNKWNPLLLRSLFPF